MTSAPRFVGRENAKSLEWLKGSEEQLEILVWMHQKNLLKKPFSVARRPQTLQPKSKLVFGHLWGKKVIFFCFVAYSTQPKLYKSQQWGLFS